MPIMIGGRNKLKGKMVGGRNMVSRTPPQAVPNTDKKAITHSWTCNYREVGGGDGIQTQPPAFCTN